MAKFAVGDLIRAIPNSPYSETNEHAICKVLGYSGEATTNKLRVEIMQSSEPMYVGDCWYVDGTWFHKVRLSQKDFMEDCKYV